MSGLSPGRYGIRRPLAGVEVCADAACEVTPTHAPKGAYAIGLAPAMYAVSASRGGRSCHAGAADGPISVDVTVGPGRSQTVDFLCEA